MESPPMNDLRFLPVNDGTKFRWLPRDGRPRCVAEWLSQAAVKAVAFAPIYIAIIVTIALVLQIWWGAH